MPVPSQSEVEPIFAPIGDAVVAIVREGWSDWLTSPYVGIWRCKRSRANFVWEQIIEHAHRQLADNPSIRIIDGQETYKFLLDDRVLFRFKKADDEGLTRNVPTQLALAFHDHDADLFGLPEVSRVDVAYVLNKLETEVNDIIVVGRDGDTVVWSFSLLDAGDGVLPLPVPPTIEPANKPPVRLVKPRQGASTEERKKSD